MRRWFSSWFREDPSPPPPDPSPPPPDTYDMILLINLHGETCSTGTEIKTCEVLPMPQDMRATFLESTSCGVINISCKNWTEFGKSVVDVMLPNFGPTKQLAKECQYIFRDFKKKDFDKRDCPVSTLEELKAFRRDKGWDIVEYKIEYVNKEYEEDPDLSTGIHDILILYSEHSEFPVETKLTDVKSRKSLLKYLHKEGVKHPFIIDNSCSGVNAGSLTANRYAVRTERKRKRTGGRKLTKRPKVKKLIHFA